jgi:serine/threonine protein kinase
MAKNRIFETATNTYKEAGSVGNGGAGTVYRVLDAEGNGYALKLLGKANTKQRKRFKNELNFCRNQKHDRIIKVLDEGIIMDGDAPQPFYVMPLYDYSLRKVMKHERPLQAPLSLFQDILDGVEAAHLQDVFHRDLKPENILIDANRRAVIADFGIAHFEEEDLLTAVKTSDQERLANYLYAAPEQRATGSHVDRRADIFALGLILNEMFTGEVPQGTGHRTIASVVPALGYLDIVVERMIRQRADERPVTIADVKEEISVRGAKYLTQQKLDAARKEVVPVATPVDPLGGVDVAAIEFGYEPGRLFFFLTPEPPPNWIMALHQLRNARGFHGMVQPTGVEILDQRHVGPPSRIRAAISANKDIAAEVVKNVREWVQLANSSYREMLERQSREEERLRRVALDEKRRALEETTIVMESIRRTQLN